MSARPSASSSGKNQAMPLKAGYSRDAVSDNINLMLREGYDRARAVAASYATARASFFHRHPHGALPTWLAFPRAFRLREHYSESGAPLMLAGRSGYRTNPAPRAADIERAARRIRSFTGMPDVSARRIRVARQSDVVLDIGRVNQLWYSTIREGRHERYRHTFTRNSRPLLAASPDGKRLYLLGGAYTFTDRGIVDRKTTRRK